MAFCANLANGTSVCNFLVLFIEEASISRRVWQEEERNDGHADGGNALNQEQKPPAINGGATRCDAKGKGA
jgi:hypothetical protein